MTDVVLRPFGHADFARLIGWIPSAGFVEEGRLCDRRRVGDEYWTSVVYALLADEWRAR